MPAMALLDTDGVYGAPRFHQAANKINIKAHIGAEVTCNPLHPVILSESGLAQSAKPSPSKSPYSQSAGIGIPGFAPTDRAFRIPLLIQSRSGYQNLCRLITEMKLRAKKGEGAVTRQKLEEHAPGLICLTGGDEGPLARALA